MLRAPSSALCLAVAACHAPPPPTTHPLDVPGATSVGVVDGPLPAWGPAEGSDGGGEAPTACGAPSVGLSAVSDGWEGVLPRSLLDFDVVLPGHPLDGLRSLAAANTVVWPGVPSTGGARPLGIDHALSCGDLDGDRDLDCVVTASPSAIVRLDNLGGCALQPSTVAGDDGAPLMAWIAYLQDLDADGLADLLRVTVEDEEGAEAASRCLVLLDNLRVDSEEAPEACRDVVPPRFLLKVHRNEGPAGFRDVTEDWGFDAPMTPSGHPTDAPVHVQFPDLNQDGVLDVLLAMDQTPVHAYVSEDLLHWAPTHDGRSLPPGFANGGSIVHDMNGDGRVDVHHLSWSVAGGPSTYWLSAPDGGWTAAESPFDAQVSAMGGALCDLDRDGHLDHVGSDIGRLLLGMGRDSGKLFGAAPRALQGLALVQDPGRDAIAWSTHCFDGNGDGWPDLHVQMGSEFAHELHAGGLFLWENTTRPGDAVPQFEARHETWAEGAFQPADSRGSLAVDLSGDGLVDLLEVPFLTGATTDTSLRLHVDGRSDPGNTLSLQLVAWTGSPAAHADLRVVYVGGGVRRVAAVGQGGFRTGGPPGRFQLSEADAIERLEITWLSGGDPAQDVLTATDLADLLAAHDGVGPLTIWQGAY